MIAAPSRAVAPKHFSRRATIIFAVLAIAAFFLRNWSYLADNRMAMLSDPEAAAAWVLHENMLVHGGTKTLTKGVSVFLFLTGLQFDNIPRDSERMLRHNQSSARIKINIRGRATLRDQAKRRTHARRLKPREPILCPSLEQVASVHLSLVNREPFIPQIIEFTLHSIIVRFRE